MKIKLAIICSSLVLGAAAQTAIANDGTVRFEGGVTDSTCEVVVNKQTNDALVKLPVVSSKLLKNVGDTAGRTFLTFELKNCALANNKTKASIYFVAGTNINTAGRLDNTEATGTKNVDLQLLDIDQDPLDLSVGVGNQGATPVAIDAATHTASIRHFVQYYATGQATAGGLKSSVEYELNYE